MRYKCLVLDHDDTVVDSTASIHYPAFLEALKILRPGVQQITLEEYFEENFDPGFIEMCQRRYQLTDAELEKICGESYSKGISGDAGNHYKT